MVSPWYVCEDQYTPFSSSDALPFGQKVSANRQHDTLL
jgi:hypothetical protein